MWLKFYSVATQGTGEYKAISRSLGVKCQLCYWCCSIYTSIHSKRWGNCLWLCMGFMLWVHTPVLSLQYFHIWQMGPRWRQPLLSLRIFFSWYRSGFIRYKFDINTHDTLHIGNHLIAISEQNIHFLILYEFLKICYYLL